MKYLNFKVYMNGKYPAIFVNGTSKHVHRLVWEQHHGKIPKGYIIHHKDENKLNWNIDNLEMISRKEHIRKHKSTVHRKGVKITAEKNDQTLTFDSIEEAAKACETYTSSIQRILNGRQKHANGWTFEKAGG